MALTVMLFTRTEFSVAKDIRCTMASRSSIAILGNTSMTVGTALVPLVYVKTINATVPFWASLASYVLIGEVINRCSKIAMAVGFVGVAVIAFSPYVLDEDIAQPKGFYGIDNPATANVIGCSMILVSSCAQGLVTTSTRMMQSEHWSKILFYYSIVAVFATSLIFLIQGKFHVIFDYNGQQFLWIFISSAFNMAALICKVISSQNEKSGVVAIFRNVGIVYAGFLDYFMFDQTLNWLEWIGVCIIIVTTISLTMHLLFAKEEADEKKLKDIERDPKMASITQAQ